MNNFAGGFVIATLLTAALFLTFWPAKPKPMTKRSHHKRKSGSAE